MGVLGDAQLHASIGAQVFNHGIKMPGATVGRAQRRTGVLGAPLGSRFHNVQFMTHASILIQKRLNEGSSCRHDQHNSVLRRTKLLEQLLYDDTIALCVWEQFNVTEHHGCRCQLVLP